MRRNNFSSASDRRWQRRYERIQQRKEEERERRDRQGREDAYEAIDAFDLGIDTLATTAAQSFTITMPRTDEPNRNGSVIPNDVWTEAMIDYCFKANEGRRSLEEEITATLESHMSSDESRSIWQRLRNAWYNEIIEAYEARRVGEEVHGRTAQEIERRGYRAQTMVVDDYSGMNIRFKNDGYIIIDDIAPFEPEPELKAGDSAELDSFLGGFVAPGA